jgi:hypothetical protein
MNLRHVAASCVFLFSTASAGLAQFKVAVIDASTDKPAQKARVYIETTDDAPDTLDDGFTNKDGIYETMRIDDNVEEVFVSARLAGKEGSRKFKRTKKGWPAEVMVEIEPKIARGVGDNQRFLSVAAQPVYLTSETVPSAQPSEYYSYEYQLGRDYHGRIVYVARSCCTELRGQPTSPLLAPRRLAHARRSARWQSSPFASHS